MTKLVRPRKKVMIINQLFNQLEQSKQDRIINAALKIFAQDGYEKASTNKIVKLAGISKGSLFNYFSTKQDLYLFLFNYTSQVFQEIYEQIDLEQRDLFERLKHIGKIKFKIMKKHPQLFDFLKSTRQETSEIVLRELNNFKDHSIEHGINEIYENIDYEKFDEQFDLEKVIEIINWTMLGFSEKKLNALDVFENLTVESLDEWDQYAAILKRAFYKIAEE